MPRSSRATAHHLVENVPTETCAPSRESGLVQRRNLAVGGGRDEGRESICAVDSPARAWLGMHRNGAIGDTGPCLHRADLFRPPGGYADAVSSRLEEVAMAGPEHIDRRLVALIAWDVCRRALTLSDH